MFPALEDTAPECPTPDPAAAAATAAIPAVIANSLEIRMKTNPSPDPDERNTLAQDTGCTLSARHVRGVMSNGGEQHALPG